MSLSQELKKNYRQIRQLTQSAKKNIYKKFPEILGHQIHGIPVQLYRHDEIFQTALSFNHFIEFFSGIEKMDISAHVESFNRNGKSLGKKSISIPKKGSFQISLSDLFPNLDQFGLFSVEMKIDNGFISDLAYLGSLHPQYMTLFIPQDHLSSAQMIHSHKLRQGHLFLRRPVHRKSSDVESTEQVQKWQFYFLNSSKSRLNTSLHIFSASENAKSLKKDLAIPGYGIGLCEIPMSEIKPGIYRFEFDFDRNVDHKKPILFRQFLDGSWSGNHT